MNDKLTLIVLLAAALLSATLAIAGVFDPRSPSGKLLSTTSGILGLASLLQLKLSGWFEEVIATYGDEEKFPYGPPSRVTRQIVHNPDQPWRSNLRDWLYYRSKTGFLFGVASIIAALVATWI